MSEQVCFALLESPFNGVIMSVSPSMDTINAIVCDWIAAGGPEALRRAKPAVIDHADDHWVTIPRSILENHDISFGEGIGKAKMIVMHVRIFRIIGASNPSEGGPVIGVPV